MLASQVVVKIESDLELRYGSLVFREEINNNSYVYLEELQKLKGFSMHPIQPIDIEKPASVSKSHPIVWRLPL